MQRTLCSMHGARLQRQGSVGEVGPRHIKGLSLGERLVFHLHPVPVESGCIEPTTGRLDEDGYPIFSHGKTLNMRAGRAALTVAGRRPPFDGAQACHTCDNRACLNVEHLYWGTTQENSADRDQRNRYGSRQALPDEMVEQLRTMHEQGVPFRQMERLTGVKRTTIKWRLGLALSPAFAKKVARHDPRRIEV